MTNCCGDCIVFLSAQFNLIVRVIMKNMLVLLSLLVSAPVFAEWKFETIEGVQVHYYLPKTTTSLVAKAQKRALMVNLHGCSQKAEDLKKDGNWENTADDYNMIVALPKVPNGGVIAGCWDYYGADHTMNNRHNAPLIKLVQALLTKTELNIDAAQVYLSGLSSGGGETMVLGCMVPEMFAGIGINAGPSTGTSSNEISRPKTSYESMLAACKKLGSGKEEFFKNQLTSIIYGNNDFIVNTAFNTNNAEIMRTIYGANNKSTFDTKKLAGTNTEGTGSLWSDDKGPRVSLIMNTNLGHNWPAGQGGNGGAFINKKSINYPDYLAKFFFTNNRRSQLVSLPEVMIDPIETKESKFIVSGTLTIPKEWVKTIDIQVKKKDTQEVVDTVKAVVGRDSRFSGFSKVLPDGEYYFDFHVINALGTKRTFKRSSWLGEVAGVNLPQIFNTRYQSVIGCFSIEGQAVSNGGDKVTSIHITIDGEDHYSVPVENTMWDFKTCNLAEGAHEAVVVAENESGLLSSAQQFSFTAGLNTATSTLQEHMEAKRLNWDEYGFWYLKYGYSRFTLVLGTDGIWREKNL